MEPMIVSDISRGSGLKYVIIVKVLIYLWTKISYNPTLSSSEHSNTFSETEVFGKKRNPSTS